MFLDTNYLIANTDANTAASRQIDEWIISGEPIHVSAMAWAEYLCGPITSDDEIKTALMLTSIEPIGAEVASFAAQLFNKTGRRSRSLPDCIIGATAILAGQPLATLNRADFEPFTAFGLTLA